MTESKKEETFVLLFSPTPLPTVYPAHVWHMAATDLHASIMFGRYCVGGRGRERERCLQYLPRGIRPRRCFLHKEGRWWWKVSPSDRCASSLNSRKEEGQRERVEMFFLLWFELGSRQSERCKKSFTSWYQINMFLSHVTCRKGGISQTFSSNCRDNCRKSCMSDGDKETDVWISGIPARIKKSWCPRAVCKVQRMCVYVNSSKHAFECKLKCLSSLWSACFRCLNSVAKKWSIHSLQTLLFKTHKKEIGVRSAEVCVFRSCVCVCVCVCEGEEWVCVWEHVCLCVH